MHVIQGSGMHRAEGVECVERSVELASGHFTYLEQGPAEAPLIILAHGFPDYPKTFLPLMAHLCRAGYRCVAPFLRGYAPSVLTGPYDRQRVGGGLLHGLPVLHHEEPGHEPIT